MFDFLFILAILVLMFGAAGLLAHGIVKLLGLDRHDDLHDVFARDEALAVLARIHDDSAPATDRCGSCNRPVLIENTYAGICADCMTVARSEAHLLFNDWTGIRATDQEWADLMRAIDDERNESEDHR